MGEQASLFHSLVVKLLFEGFSKVVARDGSPGEATNYTSIVVAVSAHLETILVP